MDPDAFLYDVPPLVLERFCRVMDSGGDTLGWRGLAVRIVACYSEVRMLERMEAAGRSPTRELLWSWAQQNSKVQDLLSVLQDMGHSRALQLLQAPDQESILPPSNQPAESTGQTPAAKVKESLKMEASFSNQVSSPSLPGMSVAVTQRDIIEGTQGFHQEARISEGHFANVYRAHIGNKTFAVKLFKQVKSVSWKKLWDIFRKEMEIHHIYKHPNILDLVGCFSDEGHYCLVCPYLPNGSLYHRLHRPDGEHPLSWEERLTIIQGIAKALHHLHTIQPCPVICGNISRALTDWAHEGEIKIRIGPFQLSCANVLLDDDLQPKLSDFGLARLRPHSTTQHCTTTVNTGSHSKLGYLPEEYHRDGKLSYSLDVYSFGMVLMETVTGRKVLEEAPKPTLLRDLLITVVENSGGGVDSCLQFLDKTAGPWPVAMILSLLHLAMNCTASRHRNRPNMESVLVTLSQLLPPPRGLPADQPHSLDDGSPTSVQHGPSPSIPVEHEEQHVPPVSSPPLMGPCECSQSEVTYLSDSMNAHCEQGLDLYNSWPVQCSCSAEDGGLLCEDCRANGFIDHQDSHHSDFSVVENQAKVRLRNKLGLYNRGLIHTGDLLSETGLQQEAEELL